MTRTKLLFRDVGEVDRPHNNVNPSVTLRLVRPVSFKDAERVDTSDMMTETLDAPGRSHIRAKLICSASMEMCKSTMFISVILDSMLMQAVI